MKKFAFAFLVIGVIFSMAVCDNGGGGSSSTNPFEGTTWQTNYEGQTFRMTFTSTDWIMLSADGSQVVERKPYTYSGNTASFESDGLGLTTATISGNTLTMQGAGMTIVFTRL